MLFAAALIPLVFGVLLPQFHFCNRRKRALYVEIVTLASSLCLIPVLLGSDQAVVTLLSVAPGYSVSFRVDGAAKAFLGLVAFLWPLAVLYAFEYMAHEEREDTFFAFYTITYSVVILLAAAANLVTLYILYECLTFATLPLVWHKKDKPSVQAARSYLLYCVSGAAMAFVAMIMLNNTAPGDFILGGTMGSQRGTSDLLLWMYLASFVGFGVKAAVFPLHRWLPAASAAPTPVTALLHAVAVVNAGAFAVLRVTYYAFGTEFLRGTFAQDTALVLSAVTIVWGAVLAVREHNLKRRLACSTISNLSYILFGIALMTKAGMAAALTHMIFHGLIKIVLFYCAGAILIRTGRTQVGEMHGMGKVVPFTMAFFTLASLALVGVPPLPGFLSKLYLITAAAEQGSTLAIAGASSLLVSAVLTAIYTFQVVIPAYFMPLDESRRPLPARLCDPGMCIKTTLAVIGTCFILLGFFSAPLTGWLRAAAGI